jgi:hypothetical protein
MRQLKELFDAQFSWIKSHLNQQFDNLNQQLETINERLVRPISHRRHPVADMSDSVKTKKT